VTIASHKTKRREYVRAMPTTWWLQRPSYLRFMLRELGSGVLAAYALLLLRMLQLAGDPPAFTQLMLALTRPVSIVLHVVALAFALLNSFTTFQLAPRALKLHRGEEQIPDHLVSGAHYLAWVVISVGLLALVLVRR